MKAKGSFYLDNLGERGTERQKGGERTSQV